MLFNLAVDWAKLSLIVVCAYALLAAYARRRRPQWTERLTQRRFAVWEAQWYWGSSFPSGHTLSTAALATAAALCVARIWPRVGSLAMALALLWTGLIAISRLVLGVHWPSDVLAAACLGAFIPLLFSIVNDLRVRQPQRGDG